MSDYSDNVIDKIKKSDIGHKFFKDMYIKLMKYIKAPADAKLINEVKKSNVLNVFYIFVIKIAVAEPLYLNIDYDKINHGILITLINELSRHDELLQCRDLRSCIYSMEFHYFSKLNYIPQKLNISLKSLLLTGMSYTAVIDAVNNRYTPNYNCLGEYLLINASNLSSKIKNDVKAIVKKAFISSDMDVDEYISMLVNECKICKCEVSYVNKIHMQKYLTEILYS